MSRALTFCIAASLLAACTKTNPDVCCTTKEDCHSFGLSDLQPCPGTDVCVDHLCVAECSTQGCAADAPVCKPASAVCEGCTESADCSRFTGTDVCNAATGACVECVAATDCGGSRPICDNSACRACKVDAECASGACGDDGACVAESNAVYMSPTGTNAGTCTRASPCSGLQFAVRATTAARPHIVMATGSYDSDVLTVRVTSAETSATRLTLHGGESTFKQALCGEPLVTVSLFTTIKNVNLACSSSTAISGSNFTLEHVHIESSSGVVVSGPVTLRDVSIVAGRTSVYLEDGASLTADRVTMRGGENGIASVGTTPTTVDIANLLVSDTSDVAVDLTLSNGTLSFATIVSKVATPDATAGLKCPSGVFTALTTRSSIVWTSSQRQPTSGMCNFVSTIAGPNGVAGAMNVDPRFADLGAGNYHLATTSPARDAVDTGPQEDFEGDARPQGARYDIGADEAP